VTYVRLMMYFFLRIFAIYELIVINGTCALTIKARLKMIGFR